MEFRVLASSSAGNAYVADDGRSRLLLECGLRLEDIQRGLGHQVSGLAGCLLSHEHNDHARAVADVLRAGVDVYASAGTWEALGVSNHRARVVRALEQVQIGTWTVLPFEAVHDAAEPLGFLLASDAGGKLLYLTDSAYCRYRFRGLTHIAVECNYSVDLLRQAVEAGRIPESVRRRILRNHMSLERLLDMLRANDLSRVEEIWLLHLSDSNSDAEEFARAVRRVTGKPVHVAGRMEVPV